MNPTKDTREGSDRRDDYRGFLSGLVLLLRHRVRIAVVPVVLAVVVVGVGLIRSRDYTAVTAFVPEGRGSVSAGVAGLAARFGVAVPGADAAESPAFYADLLLTHHARVHLADHQYAWRDKGAMQSGTLADAFEFSGASHAERIEHAVRALERRLSVQNDPKTGVIRLRIRTKWPELSHAILARALEYVNDFNLESRQTRAAAERRFVEERLANAARDLRNTEDRLEQFLQRNREYQTSPSLRFEFDRLQRAVGVAQQVFVTLSEANERAKIEEVRNTPAVTVLEPPVLAVLPDSRRLAIKALLALIIGTGLAITWALMKEGMNRTRSRAPEVVAEATQLGRETMRDLRRPWRLFGIRRRGS